MQKNDTQSLTAPPIKQAHVEIDGAKKNTERE